MNYFKSRILSVLLIVIIASCLIYGVYLLKQRGAQVRHDQAIATISQHPAEESARSNVMSDDTNILSSGDKGSSNEVVSVGNMADELPVTGLDFSITKILGVGSLTVSLVGYLRSRRLSLRYL